jgi:hypothetical protein
MSTPFPFGFPPPTAFYLSLFILTLVVHLLFMNYVLAGSAYLALVSVFTGGQRAQRQKSPTALVLRDWMPLALSGAITAGVAPLLFVQILYQQSYYTANLLLLHRWMAILPVLIVAFYLCYLLKSRLIASWPLWLRTLVGVGVFACFAFTGYSWTENHLLSLQSETRWASFYESGRMVFFEASALPRLGVLFFGAFPTMAMLVGWQLHRIQRRTTRGNADAQASDSPIALVSRLDEASGRVEARRLSIIAFAGLFLALVCGLIHFWQTDGIEVTDWLVLPYLIAALTGLALQATAWASMWQQARFSSRLLTVAAAGCVLTLLAAAVVREALRLTVIDIEALYEQHAAASRVGGISAFLLFAVVNGALIVICMRLVSGGARRRGELRS